jgi:hypothetical protein
MNKWIALWAVLIPLAGLAQTGGFDILILKKRTKTIAKYFSGQSITFYTTEGMPVTGQIEYIRNDSIFLINYSLQRIQRADGGVFIDTTGKFKMEFSLKNIGSFPAFRLKGKNLITDGSLFMLGGFGFLGLNLFNVIRDGDPPFGKDNLPNVLTGAGITAGGFLLKKAWPKRWFIGSKFSLQVLKN